MYAILLATHIVTLLAASFSCGPTEVDGQMFDLAALVGTHTFVAPGSSWTYSVSPCGATPSSLPAHCPRDSLAYQLTSQGGCFSLGRKRGAARPAAVGLSLDLVGGDSCGALPRRAIIELTCGEGETTILAVDEDCGQCCYRLRLRSPAGCAAPCPVEPRTQLACGGPGRGACSLGDRSHSGAIVAVCDCAPGVSGPSCSKGGTAPASTLDEGFLPPWLFPLACLFGWWLVSRLPSQRAAATAPPPHRCVPGDIGWPLTQTIPALLLCAVFIFSLWGGTSLALNPRLQSSPAPARSSPGFAVAAHARAVNLVAPALIVAHHPAFFEFAPFAGIPEPGFVFDFLGMRTAVEHMCNPTYMSQPANHPLRVHACLRAQWDEPGERTMFGYPIVGEEYAEYVTVLQTALNFPRGSSRPYAMIEVGCGYCHWAVSAALAARHRLGPKHPLFILALDGGSEMVKRCAAHFKSNQVEGIVRHAAVVNGDEESVSFSDADSYGGRSGAGAAVSATSFARLFTEAAMPSIVDLVDVDIQGGEEFIFDGHMELLNQRVKRVQIGTHGIASSGAAVAQGNQLEKKLEALFSAAGWEPVFTFHKQHSGCELQDLWITAWGPVCFVDGSLSFENPRLRGL